MAMPKISEAALRYAMSIAAGESPHASPRVAKPPEAAQSPTKPSQAQWHQSRAPDVYAVARGPAHRSSPDAPAQAVVHIPVLRPPAPARAPAPVQRRPPRAAEAASGAAAKAAEAAARAVEMATAVAEAAKR